MVIFLKEGEPVAFATVKNKKRVTWMLIIALVGFFALIARLFYVQIVRGSYYKEKAYLVYQNEGMNAERIKYGVIAMWAKVHGIASIPSMKGIKKDLL